LLAEARIFLLFDAASVLSESVHTGLGALNRSSMYSTSPVFCCSPVNTENYQTRSKE
jgi:hypothetical protein